MVGGRADSAISYMTWPPVMLPHQMLPHHLCCKWWSPDASQGPGVHQATTTCRTLDDVCPLQNSRPESAAFKGLVWSGCAVLLPAVWQTWCCM